MDDTPSALAACPFCGQHRVKVRHRWLNYQVYCQHCHASGPKSRQPSTAIQLWNRLGDKLKESALRNAPGSLNRRRPKLRLVSRK